MVEAVAEGEKPSVVEAVAEGEKPSASAEDLRPSVDLCLVDSFGLRL